MTIEYAHSFGARLGLVYNNSVFDESGWHQIRQIADWFKETYGSRVSCRFIRIEGYPVFVVRERKQFHFYRIKDLLLAELEYALWQKYHLKA